MLLSRALFLLLCIPSLALAQKLHTVPGTPGAPDLSGIDPKTQQRDIQPEPAVDAMRFTQQNACGDMKVPSSCSRVVLAQGEITEDTPADFNEFITQSANRSLTELYLDSNGGNVVAALKLGVLIRRTGLDTSVAPKMRCLSACVYTFLGGMSRSVRVDALMGVHRFYSTQGPNGNLDDSQKMVAFISEYATGMGASYEIMRVVSRGVGANMVQVTPQLAQELSVDNTNPDPHTWSLKPDDDGLKLFVSQAAAGSDREATVGLAVKGRTGQMLVVFKEPAIYNVDHTKRDLSPPATALMCRATPGKELSNDQCVTARPAGSWRSLETEGRFGLLLNFDAKALKALEGGSNNDYILVTVRVPQAKKSVLTLRTSASGFNAGLRALRAR